MKIKRIMLLVLITAFSCSSKKEEKKEVKEDSTFAFVLDRFADVEIMRYRIDDWESLTLQQKELIYYLSEAALCGRDIIFDQNCKYNLFIKETLENIVNSFSGNKESEEYTKFLEYVKRFWFSNGIHHHYSNAKFFPGISRQYFSQLLDSSKTEKFYTAQSGSFDTFKKEITDIIFSPDIAPLRVSQDTKGDLVQKSAVNFYENVTEKEVETYYAQLLKNNKYPPGRTPSYGINTKLVKNTETGKIEELPYKIDGLYGPAIEKIVFWLNKAALVAENPGQRAHIEKLIACYKTGDIVTWDDYNILWVQDTESRVDYVNGFIEVYTDPLGRKATWEAVVNFKDLKNNKRAETICNNAQWFEDHSPIDALYKKKEVKGVVAKVITVAQLGGDCYPATPIGINLPNADWIRKEYGSKSVTMSNIMYAYEQARSGNGTASEFYYSTNEIDLMKKYGYEADNILVDLHECLGHGSGQMLPGIGDGMLKNYHSVIEETRADLFALYYLGDEKLMELGLLSDRDAVKAGYYKFIVNGMMLQLNRIDPGHNITEAHMQNRAIIANWAFEKGIADNVIEKVVKDGKTYIKINDYQKLRAIFGQLLAEIQKVKSTGDYELAKTIVETYGVKIDPELHKEVKQRFEPLNIAPYGGFINPVFHVKKENGKITDIQVEYVADYLQQMLEYGKNYNFLKLQ